MIEAEEIINETIEDTSTFAGVSRVMYQARKAKEKLDELESLEKTELAAVKEYYSKKKASVEDRLKFLRGIIEGYVKSSRDKDADYILSTKDGTASITTTTSWDWQDTEVMSYLKENGHNMCIRVKEELDKNVIKAVFKPAAVGLVSDQGEVLPGVTAKKVETLMLKFNKAS